MIVKADILTESIDFYKDSTGVFKIGDIPNKSALFLLAPGGKSAFYAYGSGMVGYVSTSRIEFNKYAVRGLNHKNIDWKIQEAKRLEILSLRISDSIARIDSINRREELIKQLNRGIKDGLHITEFTLTGNDYKVGFEISISNYTKKTIKYITFTIAGYNDVKDREGLKTFRGVGPISFLSSGSYSFENAFFSSTITSLRIIKVYVQYTNGTTKEYIGPELKRTLVYEEDK